jgi:hypothetical protein
MGRSCPYTTPAHARRRKAEAWLIAASAFIGVPLAHAPVDVRVVGVLSHCGAIKELTTLDATETGASHRLPRRIAVDNARATLDAFCQLHNSLGGGNSEQVGIAADGAALPVGPVTPDPALEPDLALVPTKPLEP